MVRITFIASWNAKELGFLLIPCDIKEAKSLVRDVFYKAPLLFDYVCCVESGHVENGVFIPDEH